MTRKANEAVPVIFRVWPKEHDAVIAILPTLPGTYDPATCSSYMHVGQHGACDPVGLVEETRLAAPSEYAALKRELEAAPYRYKLAVRRRLAPAYRRERERAIKLARAEVRS